MNDLQAHVQTLLDQLVADGTERGAQVAFYYENQLIVDAHAGIADVRSGEKVTGQTLFPVFSTTKGMVATLIHRLVERGLFDYDTPIASLWPQFADRGKESITVRHALNHTSGLPLMPLDVRHQELLDWDVMCRKIAALKPISDPGERTQYHAMTYGWILGEVACRATGRTFPQLWHDELGLPLQIENEMFCGLPAGYESVVAWLEEPQAPHPETPPVPTPEAIPFWIWPLCEWMNQPASHEAVIPASNGIMTARSIARHYASLLPGGADGIELLPPGRVQTLLQPQPPTQNPEDTLNQLGYARFNAAFGHAGYGGSVGMANPDGNWSFAFTHNLFTEHSSAQLILAAIKNLLPAN